MQDLLAQSKKLQALTKKLEEVKARKCLRTSQEISTNPEGHIIQYYSALFNTLEADGPSAQHYSTLFNTLDSTLWKYLSSSKREESNFTLSSSVCQTIF